MARTPKMRAAKLYWVTTDDHDEDWFIFAFTACSAQHFHEETEGYNRGDASARKVKTNLSISGVPRHAQLEDLEALGFKVLSTQNSLRVVELEGEVFQEGTLEYNLRAADDDVFEARGQKRPNKTGRATSTKAPS